MSAYDRRPPSDARGDSAVLIVAVTPGLATRIGQIIGGASIRETNDPIQVREVATSGSARLIVYEAGAFPHAVSLEMLGALRVVQPRMPVLVSWKGDRVSLDEVVRIVAGVRTAIPVHEEIGLKRELLRAIALPVQPHVGARAFVHLSGTVGDARTVDHLVAAAVLLSNSRISVADFAASVSTNSRAMSRHCQEARLPPPVSLLGWTHALHIISALEGGLPSLQRVASDGGDATARGCSDYVRYHTGRAPSAWLQSSGFNGMLADFGHLVSQQDAS